MPCGEPKTFYRGFCYLIFLGNNNCVRNWGTYKCRDEWCKNADCTKIKLKKWKWETAKFGKSEEILVSLHLCECVCIFFTSGIIRIFRSKGVGCGLNEKSLILERLLGMQQKDFEAIIYHYIS